MRVACVHISHFAAEIGAKEHPELAQVALVIGGFPHERKSVLDCSEEAARFGISPGMTLRQASHLCPDAVFLPLDEAKYSEAFEEVLGILDGFSPIVEEDCLGKAFLDISGMEQLFGPEQRLASRICREVLQRTGLRSQIGVASNKFAADVAASLASSAKPLIVKQGEEKRFLEALPTELLPLSPEIRSWLGRLGLRTMGQVANLSADAVVDQLGTEGLIVHRLASGIDESPVAPRPKPVVLKQNLFLEQPLDNRDALLAAVSELLDRLIQQLKSRNQVCSQIKLCCDIEGETPWCETLTLKMPTDSKREMLRRLKHRLERIDFSGAISGVNLELAELGGEHGNQGLLSPSEKDSQEEAVRRLASHMKAKFKRSLLKKVVELDPDSRIPERRVALVDFPAMDDRDK